MQIRTEILNFSTGVIVTFCGVLNIIYGSFEIGMNWIIFGAMYLVMGDYLQNQAYITSIDKVMDFGRQMFSWVGLICSLVLVFYYLSRFGFL